MSAHFYTPADLAEKLKVYDKDGTPNVENILRWRREQSWPSVKFGKQVRFTQEHVDQIVALLETKPEPASPAPQVEVSGQTAKSARARRSA